MRLPETTLALLVAEMDQLEVNPRPLLPPVQAPGGVVESVVSDDGGHFTGHTGGGGRFAGGVVGGDFVVIRLPGRGEESVKVVAVAPEAMP